MNIREEIDQFSAEAEKPALLWLFFKYHFQSQWSFVASCTKERYGTNSYECNRVWTPTEEGWILYRHFLQE